LRSVCRGWPWTTVLLILASQVARITGVRHQHHFFSFSFWGTGGWIQGLMLVFRYLSLRLWMCFDKQV
jgi:hypothetical protein